MDFNVVTEGLSVACTVGACTFVRMVWPKKRLTPPHLDAAHLKHINEMEAELGFPLSNYTSFGVDSVAIAEAAAAKVAEENERVSKELEETLDPMAALQRHIVAAQAIPGSMLGGTDHKGPEEIYEELRRSVLGNPHAKLSEAMDTLCRSIAENIHAVSTTDDETARRDLIQQHKVRCEMESQYIQPMDGPYPIEVIRPYHGALPQLTVEEKRARLDALTRDASWNRDAVAASVGIMTAVLTVAIGLATIGLH